MLDGLKAGTSFFIFAFRFLTFELIFSHHDKTPFLTLPSNEERPAA
jgi:hypothetical protein